MTIFPAGAGIALAGLLTAAAASVAEPLPLPASEYRADVRLVAAGMNAVARHKAGQMRIDMQQGAMPMTVLLDLKSGRAQLLTAMAGMTTATDLELPPEMQLAPGASLSGTRGGSDKVAGERCTLWDFQAPNSGRPSRACIAEDGIPLRLETLSGNARQVLFEVTAVERAPQRSALFAVPPGTRQVQLPKGAVPGLFQAR